MTMMVSLDAQPNTMRGFVAGAITQENTYSVLGQPFVGQSAGYGFQVSEGIAQTQLVRESYQAAVHEGDGYNQHGFSFPVNTPSGVYQNLLYAVHGAQFNYDLLKNLKLIVLGSFVCGDLVYDGDLNDYPTVLVAGYCWTQKNLRALHYADGISPISNAVVYHSSGSANENDNLSTFGRLYSWYSAVNIPEGSMDAPVTDDNGYVQGACPNGWHIPTMLEINALQTIATVELSSPDTWLQPNDNVGGELYSALASGVYNSNHNRFEGLHTQTDFWSVMGDASNSKGTALQLTYYCDGPMLVQLPTADALSVRCVRNH